MSNNLTMDKLVALCKVRGFIFPGSEIYGGLANTWDYGPLGVEFKNNIKRAWWKKFVQESRTNVGLDSAILMNRQVWVASGHVGSFNDPLMDCRACKARFRADQLIEDAAKAAGEPVRADGWSNEQLEQYITEHQLPCPQCGKHDFTSIRKFNMMFRTHQGVTEDNAAEIFCGLKPPRVFLSTSKHRARHPVQAAHGRGADWQVLPQRDHPRQLHLPHPRVWADGAGVLLQSRVKICSGLSIGAPSCATGCSAWASGGKPPPARPQARGAEPLLQGDDRL